MSCRGNLTEVVCRECCVGWPRSHVVLLVQSVVVAYSEPEIPPDCPRVTRKVIQRAWRARFDQYLPGISHRHRDRVCQFQNTGLKDVQKFCCLKMFNTDSKWSEYFWRKDALQWASSTKTVTPSLEGDLGPHLIHISLGQPKFTPQTASRSVQPFV